MNLRTLLVDDEPLARREMRRLLGAFPFVEVVGEASHVEEAAERVEALDPQLVFLDIEMPGGTGFDLLERLSSVPDVIFTTAYDAHAVRAFEVNALDYLLKPVEPERLAAALSRTRGRTKPEERPDQLFVRDGARAFIIPIAEVRLVASEGNYVQLFWRDARPMFLRSLVQMEARLESRRFFRANRKQLMNLDFVESVEPGLAGGLHVRLRGGPEVEVSRRQARALRARLAV